MCSRIYSWFGDILPDIQGWLTSCIDLRFRGPLAFEAHRGHGSTANPRVPWQLTRAPATPSGLTTVLDDNIVLVPWMSRGENMHGLQSLEKWALFSGTSEPAAVSLGYTLFAVMVALEASYRSAQFLKVVPELANMYFHEVHLTFCFCRSVMVDSMVKSFCFYRAFLLWLEDVLTLQLSAKL